MKDLPVDCVYKILTYLPSLTQRDACKIAFVSPLFRAAADSDAIWEKFLPPDYEYFISRVHDLPVETLRSMSKKKLYFHLCDNPIETLECHLVSDPILYLFIWFWIWSYIVENFRSKICMD